MNRLQISANFQPEQPRTLIRLPAQHPEAVDLLLQHCQQLSARHARNCAWIPAQGGLLSNLRAWENLLLPCTWLQGRTRLAAQQHATQLLNDCGDAHATWLQGPVGRLSTVLRLRLLLLRALLLQPHYTLIDASLFPLPEDASLSLLLQRLQAESRLVYVLPSGMTCPTVLADLTEESPFALAGTR